MKEIKKAPSGKGAIFKLALGGKVITAFVSEIGLSEQEKTPAQAHQKKKKQLILKFLQTVRSALNKFRHQKS